MNVERRSETFGRYLSAERLEKGISLKEVSRNTRIGMDILSLIENENEISARVHRRLGFQEKKTIMLYGRPMTIYSLPLVEEASKGEPSL